MKKLKLFRLIMVLLCVAIFAFAGCNGNNNLPNGTEKDYCTVEFDSMGGSSVASQRILKGNTVNSPEIPTKESYSFLGWYKSIDENAEKWIFATDRVESDITLYAKWQSSVAQTPNYILDDILDDILIVYFSYTGNTKGVANEIISQVNGVGVEIVPAIPYTAEDTSYDSDSRSKVEQSADARPEISDQTYSQIDLAEYDTVIIGYPIWNGYEPMIIRTFIEHYDGLSGKTVYTFSTSGSTDGSTAHNNIKSRCPNADVKDNLHFTSATPSNMQTLVSEWVANIKSENEETNMEEQKINVLEIWEQYDKDPKKYDPIYYGDYISATGVITYIGADSHGTPSIELSDVKDGTSYVLGVFGSYDEMSSVEVGDTVTISGYFHIMSPEENVVVIKLSKIENIVAKG